MKEDPNIPRNTKEHRKKNQNIWEHNMKIKANPHGQGLRT